MTDKAPVTSETFFPLLRTETKIPFNLSEGHVYPRTKLIRLGAREHVLFWMTHHMVWDGWSFDIMWDELAAIYPAFSKGQPCPLMPMTIQYGDFARWQQERLKRKDMEKQLEFWRKQLSGDLQALKMPLDKPRPSVRSYRGGRVRLDIPKSLVNSLKALGDEERRDAVHGAAGGILCNSLPLFGPKRYQHRKSDVGKRTSGNREAYRFFYQYGRTARQSLRATLRLGRWSVG